MSENIEKGIVDFVNIIAMFVWLVLPLQLCQ